MGSPLRRLASSLLAGAAARWPPRSRLFFVGDSVNWVIDYEAEQVAALARQLRVRVADRRLLNVSRGQAAFFSSQFGLLRHPWSPPPHALAVAYFHGVPGTRGAPEFDACYEALCAHHASVERVQVSHSEMHEVVLGSGIAPEKVFRIPIAIDPELFAPVTRERRAAARARHGVPAEAFVVGSFVKDGAGFGDGLEPKWIKGPDVLLETLGLLKERVPELYVLLSGPARGFVRRGLDERGIPYTHVRADRYEELPHLFHAVDVCLVASRQEGGPKAVLEAMAVCVPLVTTRVGQAMDLVRHGENGWIVDVEDVEGLAHWVEWIAGGGAHLEAATAAGRRTAEANSYDAQLPLWSAFFDGFVTRS